MGRPRMWRFSAGSRAPGAITTRGLMVRGTRGFSDGRKRGSDREDGVTRRGAKGENCSRSAPPLAQVTPVFPPSKKG
jgi:hypothetical protein